MPIVNMQQFVETIATKTLADEENGAWRTINGTPVFIKEGQSIDDAIKARFGNKNQRFGHVDTSKWSEYDFVERGIATVKQETGMSDFEATQTTSALHDFTAGGFESVRAYQSGDKPTTDMPKYRDPIKMRLYDELIENYIDKAPKYDGVIYRGIRGTDKVDIRATFRAVQVGDVISMKGTSSWSSDEKEALSKSVHYYDAGPRDSVNGVLFRTKGVSKATSIRHLSTFPDEDEVIVSKSTKFRIIGKSVLPPSPYHDDPKGTMVLDIEEVKQ
jgi:hypothetical protein